MVAKDSSVTDTTADRQMNKAKSLERWQAKASEAATPWNSPAFGKTRATLADDIKELTLMQTHLTTGETTLDCLNAYVNHLNQRNLAILNHNDACVNAVMHTSLEFLVDEEGWLKAQREAYQWPSDLHTQSVSSLMALQEMAGPLKKDLGHRLTVWPFHPSINLAALESIRPRIGSLKDSLTTFLKEIEDQGTQLQQAIVCRRFLDKVDSESCWLDAADRKSAAGLTNHRDIMDFAADFRKCEDRCKALQEEANLLQRQRSVEFHDAELIQKKTAELIARVHQPTSTSKPAQNCPAVKMYDAPRNAVPAVVTCKADELLRAEVGSSIRLASKSCLASAGSSPAAPHGRNFAGQDREARSEIISIGRMQDNNFGREGQPSGGCKLFVRLGDNHNFTEAEVREIFSQHGLVTEVFVPVGRHFGHVTFATPQAANTALNKLNGCTLRGVRISVEMADQRGAPGFFASNAARTGNHTASGPPTAAERGLKRKGPIPDSQSNQALIRLGRGRPTVIGCDVPSSTTGMMMTIQGKSNQAGSGMVIPNNRFSHVVKSLHV